MKRNDNEEKIEIKKDCFAYICKDIDGKQSCDALNALYCKKEICKFYKPKK